MDVSTVTLFETKCGGGRLFDNSSDIFTEFGVWRDIGLPEVHVVTNWPVTCDKIQDGGCRLGKSIHHWRGFALPQCFTVWIYSVSIKVMMYSFFCFRQAAGFWEEMKVCEYNNLNVIVWSSRYQLRFHQECSGLSSRARVCVSVYVGNHFLCTKYL